MKVGDKRLAEMLAEGPGMVWIAADEDELFSALTELQKLRKAVAEVLRHRVGDLPTRGDIRDNHASRSAIAALAAITEPTHD